MKQSCDDMERKKQGCGIKGNLPPSLPFPPVSAGFGSFAREAIIRPRKSSGDLKKIDNHPRIDLDDVLECVQSFLPTPEFEFRRREQMLVVGEKH